MLINTDKTKAMVFTSSTRPILFEVYYDGTQLEIVDSFIYLKVLDFLVADLFIKHRNIYLSRLQKHYIL